MFFIADFHIHSKYSRATSSSMDLITLTQWAKYKGVMVLGSGDFTNPFWLQELKSKLIPSDDGLYRYNDIYFILTTEVSNVYRKDSHVKKIHNIIFAKDFETVSIINNELKKYGELTSDGRPTLNLSCENLIELILNISSECLIVPAHVWTPWFSLFGANSGFDTIEEAFGKYTKYIYALETGLSSDPAMNWRLSALDKYTLISNSDSHSPSRIAREANVFDTELSYNKIIEAIKYKKKNEFLYTIEFFPEEGKYHNTGHRSCNINLSPTEAKKYNNLCPKCGRILTKGVMQRVDDLSDREEGHIPEASAIPYKNLVPLEQIIAEALDKQVTTHQVQQEYFKIINKCGSEFDVLLNFDETKLKDVTTPKVIEGIKKVREGKVKLIPGYDGVYGKVKLFDYEEEKIIKEEEKRPYQKTLF